MHLNKILLTTDLSDESLRPFAPIAALAKETGATITVLHIVHDLAAIPHGAPLAPPIASPDIGAEVERARGSLEELRSRLPADVPIEIAVRAGSDIARGVANYAAQNGIDLIALSTHGRTGWRRLALGSVAERVLRESTIPVLSFPRPAQDPA